jgi:hypothetical protein
VTSDERPIAVTFRSALPGLMSNIKRTWTSDVQAVWVTRTLLINSQTETRFDSVVSLIPDSRLRAFQFSELERTQRGPLPHRSAGICNRRDWHE